MAFVINKSQYKSLFDSQSNQYPGPGTYQLKINNKQQNPAPFNASACKQSCFQVKQSNIGPGSYSKTCISQCFKPKLTCVSSFKSGAARFPYQKKKNDANITQNNQNEQQKSLLQSQDLRSKSTQQKFHQQKLNQKKQYLKQLRKRNQQRKINSIVNHEKGKVRILLSNPQNTENIQSFYIEDYVHVKPANGPGQYDINTLFEQKNKSVINWSKDKQKRFKKSKSMVNTNPGPGQYQLAKKTQISLQKNRKTSSFSSGGVRSFMDTIIYKTSNKIKANIMESKGLKDHSPGPGDYSPQKQIKNSFYYGKQMMSTSIQRFGINKNKITIPGPGHYKNVQCKLKYSGLVKQIRSKIFGKHGSLVKEQNGQNCISLQKQLNSQIQQNCQSYQQLVPCTIKQRCQSKAGTLSHQPRFKSLQKTKQPGPGQYYSMFDISIPSQTSGIFKSGTQRKSFVTAKQIVSDIFYQVGKQDIAAKIHKIRQNIQGLKKLAIQKPAFDSSVARFHIDQKQHTQSYSKIYHEYSPSYERDQIDYDSFKPYKEKGAYASVFKSNTKRQPFVLQTNPGPGSYQKTDILNKTSFNVLYDKLRRYKVVSTANLVSS